MSVEERILELEAEIKKLRIEINKIKDELKLRKKVELVFPYSIYANILKGLAHPIRVLLLKLISDNGRYFAELLELTRLSPATLNFHINALKVAGLVRQDVERGKYEITDLGRQFLDILMDLNVKLGEFETKELDLYCFKCGEARILADISPFYIRLWCPNCGGEHGSTWCLFLLNPFGEDWRHKNLDVLIKESIMYSYKQTGDSLKESRCINCGVKIKYKHYEDRIVGECKVCGFKISLDIHDISLDRLAEYWIRYRKIKEKLEGRVKRKGKECWKVSLLDSKGEVKLIQYIEVKTGKIIDEEVFE